MMDEVERRSRTCVRFAEESPDPPAEALYDDIYAASRDRHDGAA